MDINKLVINSILIGLFLVAILTAMVIFSNENQTNVTATDNPKVSSAFGNISSQLNESVSTAEARRVAFTQESANPTLSFGILVFWSIFDSINFLINIIFQLFNIIFLLANQTLGIPPIVTGSLMIIIIISVLLAGWKLVKMGE